MRTRRKTILTPPERKVASARRGAMVVLMAFAMLLFLVTAAFSVDVAYMQMVRTDLRAATDAAAKAGAAALARDRNSSSAVQAAIDLAAANTVGGRPLVLTPEDVEIGQATRQPDGSWAFSTGAAQTAVRVSAQMSDMKSTGAVPLFFGSLFGLREFTPQRASTAAYFDQEICLVIDRSHSMCFDLTGIAWSYPAAVPTDPDEVAYPPDSVESRWAALEESIDLFLSIASGVSPPPRVALVTWASEMDETTYEAELTGLTSPAVTTDVPLGNDGFSQVQKAVHDRGEHPMIGATNMAAGIDAGVQVLTSNAVRPFSQRTMILMSDGRWNNGRDPIEAAHDARQQGVMIHTIAFLDADQDTMQQVASITGGHSYFASNADELQTVFEELARMLPATLTD